jgi:ferredoxin-NADP reductase
VDRDLLERLLPPEPERSQRFHFICGPPPLMESAEDALLDLDVPLEQMLMERFNLV